MKALFYFLSPTVLILALSGCTKLTQEQVLQAIKDDPTLLANAIKKNPEAFKEAFQAAQEQLRSQHAKEQQEQAKKDQEKYLKEPLQPKLTSAQAYKGADSAKIVIVEYTDFECPYCSRGADAMKEVLKKYAGKVKVTVKHLPLPFHKKAMPAATYYEAIRIQNPSAAIAFHDAIFANQEGLKKDSEKFLDEQAVKAGAKLPKLKADLKSAEVTKKIEADMAEAREFGFRGTPSFLVGGVPVRGALPPEEFGKIIDLLLKKDKG